MESLAVSFYASHRNLVSREKLMLKPAHRPPWHLSEDVEQRATRACTFSSFSAPLDHHARHIVQHAILIYRYTIERAVVAPYPQESRDGTQAGYFVGAALRAVYQPAVPVYGHLVGEPLQVLTHPGCDLSPHLRALHRNEPRLCSASRRSGALPLDPLSRPRGQRPRTVLTPAGPSPGLPGAWRGRPRATRRLPQFIPAPLSI